MSRLSQINRALTPLREQLLNHPLYDVLDSSHAIRIMMEHHVFAVWDFMSLLKYLQFRLTCVAVPWTPVEDRNACRLVNEIVLAEESDLDVDGSPASHFEIYLRAMHDAGADSSGIELLVQQLKDGDHLADLLEVGIHSPAVTDFLRTTFSSIEAGDVCQVAAVFAFGREGLLPNVFKRIVEQLNRSSDGRLETLLYYLERHIELDGDEHGAMADELICTLCGNQDTAWTAATEAAVNALHSRLQLWDAIALKVRATSPSGVA